MVSLFTLLSSFVADQIKPGVGFILRTDGTVESFNPTIKRKYYNVQDIKNACNMSYIEIVNMNEVIMVCDEEGLLTEKPYNPIATHLYRKYYNQPDLLIVGDCLLCHTEAIQ